VLAQDFLETFLSSHYNGRTLPAKLLSNMFAAKNVQAGTPMMRQLEFSLFDLITCICSG